MEELTLKDLDPRIVKQIENARKVVTKNPAYAIDILSNILKRSPGALEARELLRKAQHAKSPGKSKGLTKFLTKVPFLSGSASKGKKDPEAALIAAEEMLTSDPTNTGAHAMLGAAATELGLHGTAVLAYEEFRKVEPANIENLCNLMRAHIKLGNTEDAIRVGAMGERFAPGNEHIMALIKQASVAQSINKGRWDEEEDFRSKLKDEDASQKLEQASRAATSEEAILDLIESAKERVAEEPDNMNNYREIANNYRKLKQYDNALEWLSKARSRDAGKADVTLERLTLQFNREKMQEQITAKEEQLEADPENAALKEELAKLHQESREYRLKQSEEMVKRYPNEFSYRFELGELYYEDDKIDEAIRELQLAKRSPKVRLSALTLLGMAYKKKEFYDLAIEQLSEAKAEITTMNDQKKGVLYELGNCYEAQGDEEKAIAEFKSLYGADIGYKDVSDKIDAFYAKKNQ